MFNPFHRAATALPTTITIHHNDGWDVAFDGKTMPVSILHQGAILRFADPVIHFGGSCLLHVQCTEYWILKTNKVQELVVHTTTTETLERVKTVFAYHDWRQVHSSLYLRMPQQP